MEPWSSDESGGSAAAAVSTTRSVTLCRPTSGLLASRRLNWPPITAWSQFSGRESPGTACLTLDFTCSRSHMPGWALR